MGDLILGKMGELSFLRVFERREKILLSVELLRGNLEILKRMIWKPATLSIGAPFGIPGGVSLSVAFERQMEGSGIGTILTKLIWAPF